MLQKFYKKQSYNYIHIKLPDHRFDSIALDLIGPFHPSFKGNTHMHTHTHTHIYIYIIYIYIYIYNVYIYIYTHKQCLLTYNPMSISIPDKTAENVTIRYLQDIYSTIHGSLAFITNNGKEFKNKHSQNVAPNKELFIHF